MENKLREYARLLVRVGLNPYPGQRMVISSPVECAPFARLCAEEAYGAGCCEVVMNWTDDAMTRMKYLRASGEVFDTVPLWRRHFFNDQALEGAGDITVSAVGGIMSGRYLNNQVPKDDKVPPMDDALGNGKGVGIRNGGLEASSTDVATEFANMIVTQRGFQASSRMITVSDTMLEELINLKR